MAFYVFNFGINMFVGKGLLMCNKKGWYRIFTIVQLTLIAGLRAESVGLDTHTYLEYFDHLSGTVNVGEAIRRLSWVEPGYVLLNYAVFRMGGNAQMVLFICAAIISILFVNFVFEHSESPFWGMFFLFCFPSFYDSMCFIRTSLVSAVFLFSLRYVKRKQLVRYAIVIFIGATFHIMSLLCLPLYFVDKINWKKRRNIVLFILLDIMAFQCILQLRDFTMWILGRANSGVYSGINYWIGQNSGGWKTAIFFGVLFICAYFFYYSKCKKTADEDFLAGYAFCLPLCAFLFPTAQIMIRFMILFMPIFGVFLSKEIVSIRNRNSRIMIKCFYFFLGFAFQIYTISNNALGFAPYVPFWK